MQSNNWTIDRIQSSKISRGVSVKFLTRENIQRSCLKANEPNLREMGKYQPVADEFIQTDPSSRSFCEKPFENDDLETIVEAQEDPQIPLEYSIEVGLHDPNLQQNEVSDWRRKIINIARRQRIIVGVAIFFALVLIVSLSTTASRKANQLSANEFRKSGYSSRYPGGRDKLKLGRGQGGGAGNAANIFTQTQNSNLFISDDVEIPAFSAKKLISGFSPKSPSNSASILSRTIRS